MAGVIRVRHQRPGEQIVDKGDALRAAVQRMRREKDVVVHQNRPVIHLDEQVATQLSWKRFCETRAPWAIQSSQSPQAAAIDVVAADLNINGAVELDAGHLRAAEQLPHVDVMDGVAGDGAEGGAETADDAGLFAMRNVVVADEVAADGLLVPAVGQGALDGLDVALGGIGRSVVPLVAVFAQRDARADGVADRRCSR